MNLFLTILKMLPAIIAAVKALEEFAPIPEAGKAKLDLILGFAKELGGDAEKAVPTITNVVGKIVSFANALGVFAKKP
jgi:hypothetical protein